MSPALFKMQNTRADFTNQKAYIKEQSIAVKLEISEESLVAEVEAKIGNIVGIKIGSKNGNGLEIQVPTN